MVLASTVGSPFKNYKIEKSGNWISIDFDKDSMGWKILLYELRYSRAMQDRPRRSVRWLSFSDTPGSCLSLSTVCSLDP